MASDFVDKIRTIIKYYNTPYGVNDTSSSGQKTYTNNELPEMVQKNATNEPIIDFPGLTNMPSSLTRTSNGMPLQQAIERNKDLSSGLVDTENNLIKPQNEAGFLENYRNVTKQLGTRANVNNIDEKTQSIIDKISLPTYYDALSDEKIEELKSMYESNPEYAMDSYQRASKEWNDDNYKYRVRAAQVLRKLPEEKRQKIYDLLNMDFVSGKNMLDKEIESYTQKENKAISDIVSPFIKAIREVDDNAAKVINKVFKTGDSKNAELKLTEEQLKALKDIASPFVKALRNVDKGIADTLQKLFKKKSEGGNTEVEKASGSKADSKEDVIEYTYKPGDTFGQVITDLGLKTSNGLWGPNGDVEYYTKQLEDQLWKSGVWPSGERQNIPVGTTIKLRKRK